MFNFTPLLGAQSDTRASQSILELDGGVKVLVDVGWDERFDTHQLAELEKHVPTLSFILLTHATVSHLGAFAHCCKHVPLFTQIPVYATSPVIAFGRTLLQDLYSSSPVAATFIPSTASPEDDTSTDDSSRSNILRQAPTFEEINKYFTLITPLKYSQPHQPNASYFSAPLEGLTLTAYNAGHTLGGTIWHIQHGMESIVYAVDWNQARENVIAGAAWFGGVGGGEVIEQLRKPTALVCSSVNGDKIAVSGGRKARDEALLGHIRSSLAKGGTVLIPTDSSARVLELSWLLEKAWTEDTTDIVFKNAKIYLASQSANATLRHARSLLEWMDDSIVREFEGDEDNVAKTHQRTGSKQANGITKPSRPFEFRHISVVERKARFERCLKAKGPQVIIASDLSMNWGYSRSALEQIATKPENLIVLTERAVEKTTAGPTTVAQSLWQWYQERQDGVALEKSLNGEQLEQVHTGGRLLTIRMEQKEALGPAEVQKYQQYIATQRQIQDSLVSNDNRQASTAEDAMDDDDSSSSESDVSEDEQQGRALNVSAALGHGSRNKVALSDEDLGVSVLVRKRGIYDYDVRNKRGRNAVFPYTHSRRRGDEFGDFIKPEDFLREEEKEEQDSAADKQANMLGQKRKWDDTNKARSDHANKKQHLKREEQAEAPPDAESGDSESSDESEDEPEVEASALQGPSKVVFSELSINVSARLAFVDYAGLHDQRSLQMLIPLIGSKKLILTAGSSEETMALAADCRELLGVKIAGSREHPSTEIFTPQIGQTVDASVDTNAWIVKLSRNLARRLQWQNVKNIGIVTVTGQLRAEPAQTGDALEPTNAKKLKLEDEVMAQSEEPAEKTKFETVLEPVPISLAASTRSSSQPIHVGDLRLADLRRLMNTAGHLAEFRGEGTLLVDGMIAVRKLPSGQIVVEGAPVNSMMPSNARGSNSFTQVKQKIYEGLAVVAAG